MGTSETIIGSASSWRAELGLRTRTARYVVPFPRTLGDASTMQALGAILNASADRALVLVACPVWTDGSAAIATLSGALRLSSQVAAALGGGTAIPKVLTNLRESDTDAGVTALGATSSDGGAATPITGAVTPTPASGIILGVQAPILVMQTAAATRQSNVVDLIAGLPPVILPGAAALLAIVSGVVGSNPTTQQYGMTMVIEEYLL